MVMADGYDVIFFILKNQNELCKNYVYSEK